MHATTVAVDLAKSVFELAVQARSNHNTATCALANKLTRICYAALRDQEPFASARLNRKLTRQTYAMPA